MQLILPRCSWAWHVATQPGTLELLLAHAALAGAASLEARLMAAALASPRQLEFGALLADMGAQWQWPLAAQLRVAGELAAALGDSLSPSQRASLLSAVQTLCAARITPPGFGQPSISWAWEVPGVFCAFFETLIALPAMQKGMPCVKLLPYGPLVVPMVSFVFV